MSSKPVKDMARLQCGDGFTYEVNGITESEWARELLQFQDVSLYQTWQHGASARGGKHLEHVVVRREGRVAAAAQLRVARLPVLGSGVAYCLAGPMWRRSRGGVDALRAALTAIREHFAIRSRLKVLLVPNIARTSVGQDLEPVFEGEGFRLSQRARPYHTFLVDLRQSGEAIRSAMHRSWRRSLRKAESNGLDIRVGTDDAMFAELEQLCQLTRKRKRFRDVGVPRFRAIQRELPPALKMTLVMAYKGGQALAGQASSSLGDRCLGLIGGADPVGLETCASYAVYWHTMLAAKERGMPWYDFGGVDPEKNPNVYAFKARSGAAECRFLGQYEACHSVMSNILAVSGTRALAIVRRLGSSRRHPFRAAT